MDALAAALLGGEVQEEARHADHAGALVHNDHAARAHDGARGRELVVVDDGVELARGHAAAGGAAELDGLELLAAADASANVKDDFAKRLAHGNLHKAAATDLAGKGKHLGALGVLGAHGGKRLAAVVDDPRDVGVGLHVVDVGRLEPVAGLRRERRLKARHATLALERFDKGGLFSAHKRAGTGLYPQGAAKVAAADVVAQVAALGCVFDGLCQAHDGQRVLGAHVDDALACADAVGADEHALDEAVRVAFDHGAVHKGAGVALVRVADKVLLVALGVACGTPLKGGGEARAATAAQSGYVDLLDDVFLRHARGQDLADGRVAAVRDVVVDALWVNDAAVAKRHARLLGQELLVLGRYEQLAHERKVARGRGVIDRLRVLLLHLYQPMQLAVIVVQVHDGFEEAHADAAGDAKLDARGVVVVDELLQRLVNAPGAGGKTAAAFSDYDPHACSPSFLLCSARVRMTLRALSGVRLP